MHHGITLDIMIVIHRTVGKFGHETLPIRAVEKAQLIQHFQKMRERNGRVLEAHVSAGLVYAVVNNKEMVSDKVECKDQLSSLSSDHHRFTVA